MINRKRLELIKIYPEFGSAQRWGEIGTRVFIWPTGVDAYEILLAMRRGARGPGNGYLTVMCVSHQRHVTGFKV